MQWSYSTCSLASVLLVCCNKLQVELVSLLIVTECTHVLLVLVE
jgi:hypothetical protein